jgi:hypothetical protein
MEVDLYISFENKPGKRSQKDYKMDIEPLL